LPDAVTALTVLTAVTAVVWLLSHFAPPLGRRSQAAVPQAAVPQAAVLLLRRSAVRALNSSAVWQYRAVSDFAPSVSSRR
jgi:hypothetical protein